MKMSRLYINSEKKLAFALIDNKWISTDELECREVSARRRCQHKLRTCPCFARAFVSGKWDLTAKSKYQQHTCESKGFKTPIRTYCSCYPGVWVCKNCHSKHIYDLATSDSSGYCIQLKKFGTLCSLCVTFSI